jgi:hypothetical protein
MSRSDSFDLKNLLSYQPQIEMLRGGVEHPGGRMISAKPVPLNTCRSIHNTLDPDSNATEEGDLHQEKHSSPKTSTDAGGMISMKTVPSSAQPSIRDNLKLDSNATKESHLILEKHPTAKSSTKVIAGRLGSRRVLS